jgi:hypothetical protein
MTSCALVLMTIVCQGLMPPSPEDAVRILTQSVRPYEVRPLRQDVPLLLIPNDPNWPFIGPFNREPIRPLSSQPFFHQSLYPYYHDSYYGQYQRHAYRNRPHKSGHRQPQRNRQ